MVFFELTTACFLQKRSVVEHLWHNSVKTLGYFFSRAEISKPFWLGGESEGDKFMYRRPHRRPYQSSEGRTDRNSSGAFVCECVSKSSIIQLCLFQMPSMKRCTDTLLCTEGLKWKPGSDLGNAVYYDISLGTGSSGLGHMIWLLVYIFLKTSTCLAARCNSIRVSDPVHTGHFNSVWPFV